MAIRFSATIRTSLRGALQITEASMPKSSLAFFRGQPALCLGSMLAKLANRCEKEANFIWLPYGLFLPSSLWLHAAPHRALSEVSVTCRRPRRLTTQLDASVESPHSADGISSLGALGRRLRCGRHPLWSCTEVGEGVENKCLAERILNVLRAPPNA